MKLSSETMAEMYDYTNMPSSLFAEALKCFSKLAANA